jgi:hypothetical protein
MSDPIIDDVSIRSEYQQHPNAPRPVPNADLVLVLGICSIIFCLVYGVVGIACGWIGLHYFGKVRREYESNPTVYTDGSFANAKAGKVCCIVGMSLGALFLLIFAVAITLALTRHY